MKDGGLFKMTEDLTRSGGNVTRMGRREEREAA